MTKAFSPRVIIAFFIVLATSGILYFVFFQSDKEIYVNEDGSLSAAGWQAALSKIRANAISENLVPAENLGEPPNLTDAFVNSLASALGPRILQGDLSNISQSDIQGAASYISQEQALVPGPTLIAAEDLKISPNNDAASIKKYFNDVASVYQNTLVKLKKSDITIMHEVFSLGKTENLSQLAEVTAALELVDAGIKKITVPSQATDFAVKEINYVAKTLHFVRIFEKADSDPLRALAALVPRAQLMDEARKFHLETGRDLESRGIIFNDNDAAKIIFN